MSNMDADMIIINVVAKKGDKTIELSVPDDVFNQAERILLKNERGVFCKTFPAEAFDSDSWISVKEDLPKTNPNTCESEPILAYDPEVGKTVVFYHEDGYWYDIVDRNWCRVEPTHWMPLPDDPQEDKND